MKKAEKICAGAPPGVRKDLKRRVRRSRRRAEKLDPELAGRRIRDFVRGWSD
jgi:hypothetical protein